MEWGREDGCERSEGRRVDVGEAREGGREGVRVREGGCGRSEGRRKGRCSGEGGWMWEK